MRPPPIIALLVVLAIEGCGGAGKGDESSIETTKDGVAIDDPLGFIFRLENGRIFDERLAFTAVSNQSHIREATAVALGRIGDPRGAAALSRLLADPDSRVRCAAGFAAGELIGQNRREMSDLIAALIERLALEAQESCLASVLGALGEVRDEVQVQAVGRFVRDERVKVRVAALETVGWLARGQEVSEDVLSGVWEGLSDDSDSIRLAAAYALHQVSPATQSPAGTKEALQRVIERDSSAEVRIWAIRTAARRGILDLEVALEALDDSDYRVGLEAIAAVGVIGNATLNCASRGSALERIAKRVDERPSLLETPAVHLVGSALDLVSACGESERIEEAANRILKRVKEVNRSENAAGALTGCLAKEVAGLSDLEILACDAERPETGKLVLIKRLARTASVSAEARETLRQFLFDADIGVAREALDALAKSGEENAERDVISALADRRAELVSAALRAIAREKEDFRSLWSERGKGGGLNIVERLNEVITRFEPFEHAVTPILCVIGVVSALGHDDARVLLERLSNDRRSAVRAAVMAAYNAIDGLEPPKGLPSLKASNTLSFEEWQRWRRSHASFFFRTTRGDFSVALDSENAPLAVARFFELAEGGYFNDTPVVNVSPGYTVRAGDPSGTGLADSEPALQSERAPVPFERGVMGVDSQGKDAGGPGFFISLTRDPGMDGRRTVLGRVTSGIETVDLLERGDRIVRVVASVEE